MHTTRQQPIPKPTHQSTHGNLIGTSLETKKFVARIVKPLG
ncbi:hypothetical protein HMPREF0299_6528 [Corynebacterium matruchotii ATCC 14266]|uniref:Uncharacterized protein n=1 Tax=Corynebacterium matruchotii ATCC 14266 TaxID=553207 RepID=E0DF91_9CORY|nr:hypothetical protein HMPREF0299_6528 [Corynebacterium matruchotii ATCC 14266]